ncbi:MAG: hypothetical protein ABIQ31_23995 [Ferruginibacter sp.]
MKIENIIDDIQRDMMALRDAFEERFRTDNPNLSFSVSLPDIDELTTIKSMTLSFEEANTIYYLSVLIHTHNGNRVFENSPKVIIDNQLAPNCPPHPHQSKFIDLLREIIKKNKSKSKPAAILNEAHQYSRTG